MFVHSNANIIDFREKAFSLFFFYALLISSAMQRRLWGLLAPWPLGVFRYRLLRSHLSTDCTSMLNLPFLFLHPSDVELLFLWHSFLDSFALEHILFFSISLTACSLFVNVYSFRFFSFLFQQEYLRENTL